jgi:hypothetical protein
MRCKDIDDREVEAFVFRRLENEAARSHLETCEQCAVRIAEAREFIAAMKAALRTDETA